ncbi:MAG: hypothetical protein WC602_03000 [archaeon]
MNPRAPLPKEIYAALFSSFGPQGWWPVRAENEKSANYHPQNYSLPETESQKFEVCAGAILCQNTSWKNASKAIGKLRSAKALNGREILALSPPSLAKLIHSSGCHSQKARKLREFAEFNGKVSRESLLGLWGIGPETADSILLYAHHEPVFVVDAYTKRIFSRIGLCAKNADYREIQSLVHSKFSVSHREYNEFHALLVKLGKDYCRAKPVCRNCPLKGECAFGKSRLNEVL